MDGADPERQDLRQATGLSWLAVLLVLLVLALAGGLVLVGIR